MQDKARVGQKKGITCSLAKRGTRPSAPKDQRKASAYIYEAICPAEGEGAALVLLRCNTEGMTLHLAKISTLSHRTLTPRCSSIRPDGTAPARSSCPPTSPCRRCRRNAPSSIGRECLAVHPRQSVIEQDLQILRRHPQPLLLRLELPRRSALTHHVHRFASLGVWVTVNGTCYTVPMRFRLKWIAGND